MDKSVAPGDDFFGYANGSWMAKTEIPSDRSRWTTMIIMTEEATARTRQLLESVGPDASAAGRKAADFYASLMDEAGIEARQLTALRPALDAVAAIGDRPALARALGSELRADVDPLNATNFHTDRLFGLWASVDLNDPSRNVAYLLQGGLDMPDREYYLSDSPRMSEIQKQFTPHIAKMLNLAGYPDADRAAALVAGLERKIAAAHATRLESLRVRDANNPWKRTEFPSKAPGLDWNAFFNAAGLDGQMVIMAWHPHAISKLSALVASEPLAAWKAWLAFHTIDRRADQLPMAIVNERFAFHGQVLSGTPKLPDRWKRSVAATGEAVGEAVGQLYVARYFPPEAKAQIQALVAELIAAFGERLNRLDWMSAPTRERARAKLKTLVVGIGYPDRWIDYAPLEIVRGDPVGNADRAERFKYARSLAKLGAPVDKAEWWMTPQTVNAVNLPLQNALNFPAGILTPPFFNPAAPAAVNYGAIGAVIGHEISHSFDDQGALFDDQGRLADWWTKEDFTHFEASGRQLAEQYGQYQALPDLRVNGNQTLSENIADLAGLATAYDAWQRSLHGAPAPTVDGFTGAQQFFLSYAQTWRANARDAALRQQIITDGHAPGRYRAATVRNLDAWYDAFDVKAGQRLFLPPGERVRVW